MSKLFIGVKPGVGVFQDNDRIFVETKRWGKRILDCFSAKYQGEYLASFYKGEDVKPIDDRLMVLLINPNLIKTDEQIEAFNARVDKASEAYLKLEADHASIVAEMKQKLTERTTSTLGRVKVDKILTKAIPVHRPPSEKANFAFGMIAARNDNYVALQTSKKQTEGDAADIFFFRVINVECFLLDKEERRNEKAVLDERLKIGEHKILVWGEDRKIRVKDALSEETFLTARKKSSALAQ